MDKKDKANSHSARLNKNNSHPHDTKARLLALVMLVLISTSAGFLGGWAGANNSSLNSSDQLSDHARQQVILNDESQLISAIAKNVGPSVVSVNVTSQSQSRGFFSFGEVLESQSAGTGFIISEDGIIVTNRHVIPEGTSEVSVTLSDGTELENVEIIGRTSPNDPLDVAFLKVNDAEGKTLSPVTLGDSSQAEVGERVIAIGNALGQFQNTVTSGILSGFGRSVVAGSRFNAETLQNLFQTDAAINQGNSGGPLVNIQGEVIAINTAVAGGGAENIGFAIPINDVKGLINSVLDRGVVERPYLGVRYVSLTDDVAENFELDVKRGAFIVPSEEGQTPSVISGSPADQAGLQEGDVITAIDGDSIDEDNSLVSLVGRKNVGDTVALTIVRDGQEQSIEVVLQAAPDDL